MTHTAHWDQSTNCFIIDGKLFSPEFFEMMYLVAEKETDVKIIRDSEGCVSFKRLSEIKSDKMRDCPHTSIAKFQNGGFVRNQCGKYFESHPLYGDFPPATHI